MEAEDMLKNILGNPGAMEQVMHLMQSLGGDADKTTEKEEKKASPALSFGLENPETLLKLSKAFGRVAKNEDPRVNLLMAIRPYLSQRRAESADKAMQILKLSQMTALFEEMKIF